MGTGAFEIPLAAKKLAFSGKYDAIICVGAVIRGSTSHYDYVCAEVSKGIAQVGLESGLPVLFGVLTTDTIRTGDRACRTKAGNKGYDCAMSALGNGQPVQERLKNKTLSAWLKPANLKFP